VTDSIIYNNIKQKYNLFHAEVFSEEPAEGWTNNDVSSCGAI